MYFWSIQGVCTQNMRSKLRCCQPNNWPEKAGAAVGEGELHGSSRGSTGNWAQMSIFPFFLLLFVGYFESLIQYALMQLMAGNTTHTAIIVSASECTQVPRISVLYLQFGLYQILGRCSLQKWLGSPMLHSYKMLII